MYVVCTYILIMLMILEMIPTWKYIFVCVISMRWLIYCSILNFMKWSGGSHNIHNIV